MIDAVQIVLLSVIVILTLLLVMLGVQVFFILRELRNTVKKANKVLDDTGTITESVSVPMNSISSFIESFTAGAAVARIAKIALKTIGDKKSRRDYEDDGEQ